MQRCILELHWTPREVRELSEIDRYIIASCFILENERQEEEKEKLDKQRQGDKH